MNKNRFFVCAGVILCVMLALLLIGCAASNPKALAKQAFQIGVDLENGKGNSNALIQKLVKIDAAYKNMSDEDKDIYQQEFKRLGNERLEKK